MPEEIESRWMIVLDRLGDVDDVQVRIMVPLKGVQPLFSLPGHQPRSESSLPRLTRYCTRSDPYVPSGTA
jgi:hypothetical protein